MTTTKIARVWMKFTVADCFWVGRAGLFAGALGAISVYLFRPGTNPDEVASFIVVPIAIFYILMRLLASVASRINTERPRNAVEIEFRIKLLVWIMFFDMVAVIVGLPSVLVYRTLGIGWAADFTSKALIIFAVSAFGLGVIVRTGATFLFEIGRRIIDAVSAPRRHNKLAHC